MVRHLTTPAFIGFPPPKKKPSHVYNPVFTMAFCTPSPEMERINRNVRDQDFSFLIWFFNSETVIGGR